MLSSVLKQVSCQNFICYKSITNKCYTKNLEKSHNYIHGKNYSFTGSGAFYQPLNCRKKAQYSRLRTRNGLSTFF